MDTINRYGFRYNVNHPAVRKRYLRFKKSIGVPEHFPISDARRLEFESHMDKLRDKGVLPPEAFNRIKENDL